MERVRLTRLPLLAIIVALMAPVLYVAAGFSVLASLNEPLLISAWMLESRAPTQPASFPIASSVRTAYWRLFGRRRVLAANRRSSELLEYAAERIVFARERNELLDNERALEVLTLLVCNAPPAFRVEQDLTASQKHRIGSLIRGASKRCSADAIGTRQLRSRAEHMSQILFAAKAYLDGRWARIGDAR